MTDTKQREPLGLIQSRGLGDIIIALPIARYYHDQGRQVHWPISKEFIPHLVPYVPWITWHELHTDQGSFFYEQPQRLFDQLGIGDRICLYQALTGHDFHLATQFQHTKFDQYKYIVAGVPFKNKWQLRECLVRRPEREQVITEMIARTLGNQDDPYILVHLQGSDHRAAFDDSILPKDIPVIEITDLTTSVFDWLGALERAWAVITVDSVFSNLIDQLGLLDDQSRYFIPRSHIGLTPVLAEHWTWLANTKLDSRTRSITV